MHPAEKYIEDVLSGKQVVCKFARLAVERHVRDLKDGHKRGLHFSPELAQHRIDFNNYLHHSKGEWAGQVFKQAPWQQFISWCVYGWMRADGTRRFREAYLEVSRKNGKSTGGAADGNYLAFGEGEPGAEVYTAATKKDQAKLIHEEAKRMVRRSPALRRSVKILRDNLHMQSTASKFEPLGSDSETQDGLNIHGSIIDELHAHKTRELCDVIDTATGSRRQPLILYITTAGESVNSICWEKRDYIRKILTGQVEDDDVFGIIFTLDVKSDWPELLSDEESKKPGAKGVKEDSWDDESVWIKANPNLGVSCKLDDLRRKARKAKAEPDALASFLRYHLDVWTSSALRWMPMPAYDACGDEVVRESLKGIPGFAAYDLSTTTDLTALVCAFPLVSKVIADDKSVERIDIALLPFFWLPEESLKTRSKHEAEMLRNWIRQGLIRATPGRVVDYNEVESKLEELEKEGFILREAAFDPYNATNIVNNLTKKGVKMVPFRQGFLTMSPACKQFMTVILQGRIKHGGHPVLRWMFDNVVVDQDPAGNIKPNKSKSYNRIDGAVASIMAADRALRREQADAPKTGLYKDRGFVVVG
ncbi:MAG TPA: hypothetical protein DCM05_09040 [Elusimicrobia bacterium]|nr:hypothetical protein [Elusimicrobiota bacterium]